ncbi:DUF3472 domain-containing protein [Carboxylicivirga sp. M1479]|uniref:DUF3472 domain-containing protein n=1 Tax=Carboxylicivirga sp. M1479 TaxID=2594476 RepID=UPI00117739B5|nr:DUF3472 domain-containing protein [Carboxylicivirga sp. M1479]TRX71941.1 DUF3472 domain-containing protein [Carboxylicivirga sp. M1479]
MKIIGLTLFITVGMLLMGCVSCSDDGKTTPDDKIPTLDIRVPAGGNTWLVGNVDKGAQLISEQGVANWTSKTDVFRIYFKLPATGELHLGLNAKVISGKSQLKCTLNGVSNEVELKSTRISNTYVGAYTINEPGYYCIEIEGLSKEAATFAEIKDVMLGGEATKGKVYFVNEEFYWGRRGPSVHLSYEVPTAVSDVEYFYNEITVPEGQDKVGSYYMANGFGEGYFGIQVNSNTERRILFSVWSPYQTDDPSSIPEEDRIKLVRKGDGVTTGEFGNEGSGGQSYWKYNWITGNTYQFLLKGEPVDNGYTQYTAWFNGPEFNEWQLIASFKRPKTQTWLTRPHSFLENFHTETGAQTRKAFYNNQWVRATNGQWYEMVKARFTADATARKESRMDYAGGVEEGSFFMQNCGFFNHTTAIDSEHTRSAIGQQPDVDVSKLP